MKLAVLTAALVISASAITPAATAAPDAKLRDCVAIAKQVATALDSAQPGDTTAKARAEESAGRSYCLSQMYSKGVARYQKALELLGKA